MTTKKSVPAKVALAKPAFKLPAALQQTGLRAVQRIPATDLRDLRSTPSGRRVAATFATEPGRRPTNILHGRDLIGNPSPRNANLCGCSNEESRRKNNREESCKEDGLQVV